jgi:hypothetical protein
VTLIPADFIAGYNCRHSNSRLAMWNTWKHSVRRMREAKLHPNGVVAILTFFNPMYE